MNVLSNILVLLLPILQILIIRKYMIVFLGTPNKKIPSILGWGIYWFFLILGEHGNFLSPQLILASNIILIFAISYLSYFKKVKQLCIFSLSICTVWMLVEIIVALFLGAMNSSNSFTQEFGSFFSKMIMILLFYPVKRYLLKKHYVEISFRSFMILLPLPLISLYFMDMIFQIASAHNEYEKFSIITGFLLIVVNFSTMEIYEWMCKDVILKAQNRLFKQQLELYSQQTAEQEAFFLEIRRLKHDIKNHLCSLQGLINAGDITSSNNYIQELLNDTIDLNKNAISHTGNIAVDSLVNHKYAIAQKNNIEFTTDIFIPASLPFQNEHLVIILGNLLENAIEACQKVTEKKYITLDMRFEKGVLNICINNSCLPILKKDPNGKYITTKNNSTFHGIGLTSVNMAVSYYHGDLITQDSNNNFRVVVILYE